MNSSVRCGGEHDAHRFGERGRPKKGAVMRRTAERERSGIKLDLREAPADPARALAPIPVGRPLGAPLARVNTARQAITELVRRNKPLPTTARSGLPTKPAGPSPSQELDDAVMRAELEQHARVQGIVSNVDRVLAAARAALLQETPQPRRDDEPGCPLPPCNGRPCLFRIR